jgi:hypothetical protein
MEARVSSAEGPKQLNEPTKTQMLLSVAEKPVSELSPPNERKAAEPVGEPVILMIPFPILSRVGPLAPPRTDPQSFLTA